MVKGDEMDNNKYNKRRRSITEFRSSYSDNKKYFFSTDKKAKWQPVVRYLIIAAILIGVVIASFILTDALLEISNAPYDETQETTTTTTSPPIDDKYFENQVTIPADDYNGGQNNDIRE